MSKARIIIIVQSLFPHQQPRLPLLHAISGCLSQDPPKGMV